MLATILREHWLTARAVVGFFPCNSIDEEIEVYSDATRSRVLHRLHHLRQQKGKPAGSLTTRCRISSRRRTRARSTTSARSPSPPASASRSISSVSPRRMTTTTTSCSSRWRIGLAEASAEALHLRVRRELWGYAPKSGSPTTS
jgi:5-methyltetrahydrofolate--homocysteine methyltransferase